MKNQIYFWVAGESDVLTRSTSSPLFPNCLDLPLMWDEIIEIVRKALQDGLFKPRSDKNNLFKITVIEY